jgi:hypothetical protein
MQENEIDVKKRNCFQTIAILLWVALIVALPFLPLDDRHVMKSKKKKLVAGTT